MHRFVSAYTVLLHIYSMICLCFMVFLMTGCLSAPADDPIRVDLPVYNQPQEPKASDVYIEPLEAENHPGVQIRHEKLGGLLAQKVQAANVLTNKAQDITFGGIFAAPISTRETALQETEGWGSKTLSIKENLQNLVAGLLQPKPIVDTLREEEKYGNSGDKFYAAGRAVVGGAEGVSNLVNTALEVPGQIFRKITRTASEKLNNVGAKLIGLN